MLSLKEQIELLEKDLSNDDIMINRYHNPFLAIFRYEPEDEFRMRNEVQWLATRLENKGRKVNIIQLSDLFFEAIEREGGKVRIIEEEKMYGFKYAQDSLNVILSDPDYSPIANLLEVELQQIPHKDTIVFLTRAGIFAPASYKLSTLLDEMKAKTTLPCVLFYPGSFKDQQLFFMGKFDQPPGSYHMKIYNR